jgi:hypothetical protein
MTSIVICETAGDNPRPHTDLLAPRVFLWYYQDVREIRVTRVLAALGCIAVLVWCTAVAPSAAHFDLAFPVLAFCFLVVLTPFRIRLSEGDPAAQPLSFLSIHSSRAPPLA